MPRSLSTVQRLALMHVGILSLLLTPIVAQNETVDFTAAVVMEASIAPELAIQNLSNPVPLPLDPAEKDKIPGYDDVLILAAGMPAKPVTMGDVNFNAAVAEIQPPSENQDGSSQLSGRQNAMRVLVVGDSMTHCHEGDYTWRYRLLEWFNAQGIPISYVGPYAGTIAPDDPAPPPKPLLYREAAPVTGPNTSGGYAVGTNSLNLLHHFAVSGRAAAVDQNLIEQVARDYPADLMLIKLGFNDLGWFYSDDVGLINSMGNLINRARRANPNTKFVVATVVHRTFIGGRQDLVTLTDSYNKMLKEKVGEWSTASSPVVWAPVREEYDCGPQYASDCPAAYDGLHPNELGDYQIARGFSRALISAFGIGNSPLEVPGNIPSRALPVPSNFQMGSSDQGVTATWDKVYGAYEYDIEYKINGGALFNFSPGQVRTNRWDTKWSLDGWTYEVRIRSSAGNRKGAWSGWSTATARPHTAAAPTNVTTRATANGIDVSWVGSTGPYSDTVTQYNVYWWDQTGPCSFISEAGFLPGRTASLVDLVPGHKYLVAIEAWNAAGAGFPFVARSVVPGGGTPATVAGLQVGATDPTTVHLTWDAVPGAAGYFISTRNINEAGSELERGQPEAAVGMACADIYFQFPGTWNYEYAVTAFNGEAESAISQGVAAPPKDSPPSSGVCPETPPFCPPGSGGGAPGTDPIDPGSPKPVIPGNPNDPNDPDDPDNPDDPDDPNDDDGGDSGCQGSDCDNDTCNGPRCCRGLGCGSDGNCIGLFCLPGGCSGPLCDGGRCTGLSCCSGPGCSNGNCVGPRCYQGPCSGPDCADGMVCNGPFCCFGPECIEGTCVGPRCTTGSEQNEEDCSEPETASICTETVTSFTSSLGAAATTTTITGCDEITACNAQDATRTVTANCQCTACDESPDPFFTYGPEGPEFRQQYPDDFTVVVAGTTLVPSSAAPPTPEPTSEPEPEPTTQPEAPTFKMCISSSTTPTTGGSPIYNYIAFPFDGGCDDGTFIADPNIGSRPDFCTIPRKDPVLDYCNTKARFVDQGKEYRDSGCALSVEIDGRVYSDYELLDGGSDENPCSLRCGTASITGLLVFSGLPGC